MTFLAITCIDPVSSFLGCVPLAMSMIIMACIMAAISGYTYYEAQQYFDDTKFFGFINKDVWLVLEIGEAVLLFMTYIIKKKCFSRLMYLGTLFQAGFALSFNVHKLSVLDLDGKMSDKEEHFIKWLFFIRMGGEFLAEMMICYMCYSLKKEE